MFETCCICDERTGRAGKHDDSLYGDKGDGPYCEKCFIWKYGQSTMSNKESEVKDDR